MHQSSNGVSWVLRLRVFLTRGRLDRQIAARHNRESAAALALRSRQLTEPRTQQLLAKSLRGAVEHVDRVGFSPDYSAVVMNRSAVRSGREAILGLAERLERAAPVNPRGMVLARELITDGATSPLYDQSSRRTVAQAIWNISDALGPEELLGGFPEEPLGGFDAIAC